MAEPPLVAGTPKVSWIVSEDTAFAARLVGALGTALAAHRQRQEAHLVHANSVAEALMRTLLRPLPHEVGHVLGLRHNFAGSLAATMGRQDIDDWFKAYITGTNTLSAYTSNTHKVRANLVTNLRVQRVAALLAIKG